MKRTLKLWLASLVCALAFTAPAHADNDKPITVAQLPSAAQTLISKHFGDRKVALAKMESGLLDKSYDVIFTSGEKIEFDRRGQWTEITCRQSAVPDALVPEAIRKYVRSHYAGAKIISIERDGEYEVDLSNRVELTFNKKFQLIDIDY